MKTTTSPTTYSTLHSTINNINTTLNDNNQKSTSNKLTNVDMTNVNILNMLSNNSNELSDIMNLISEPCDRTQEPITSFNDINNIISYYLNNAYVGLVNVNIEKVLISLRNAMLFICGINMGIRVSDLRLLKYAHLINSKTGGFKKYFYISEKKTSKSNRIFVNEAVRTIVTLFLKVANAFGKTKDLQDYLFVDERVVDDCDKTYEETIMPINSEFSVVVNKVQSPLTYNSISPITIKACNYLNINGKHNTHCLRKTFAWAVNQYYLLHYGVDDNKNSRALLFLQYRFKHSSTLVTEHYMGLTNNEDETVCMNLNLGLSCVSEWIKLYSNEISKCETNYKNLKENNKWYCG